MAVTPTYPGVYIEELPSGVRTIAGVATSITAFVGRARRGRINWPTMIHSYGDFDRRFGGLWRNSTMSYAVRQYFMNGGSDALIVRVVHTGDATAGNNATVAALSLPGAGGAVNLEAASEGEWGNELRVRVDWETRDPVPPETADSLFNLMVYDRGTEVLEVFRNLSTDPTRPRYAPRVLDEESDLVRVVTPPGTVPAVRPAEHPDPPAGENWFDAAGSHEVAAGGQDGVDATDAEISGNAGARTGIHALDHADLFNLLCIPPINWETDVGVASTLAEAVDYCVERRAFLIVDPPGTWDTAEDVANSTDLNNLRTDHAAVYFPRFRAPDPLQENRAQEFVPCGAVAGVFARTDAQRGVWKAPAGLEAGVLGLTELSYKLTDPEQGQINPLGFNGIRSFPVTGTVVWGARTLAGADRLASEWKYIPVRRTALFIEESLYRGTQWVVFEPNDEPLWSQIRLNVGAFMHNLFRQGAFQGTTPRDAYFVRCDSETTTQTDIDNGRVNILVGFAPLKPAEFVIVQIQQKAQQPQT